MSDKLTDNGKKGRSSKRSDPRALARFLQELSWLLAAYEDLDFRALQQQIEAGAFRRNENVAKHGSQSTPPVGFLVGALPDLFTDEVLFPANEDIADFAQQALGVIIPRWSKKSKYELIGHVVCHTSVADSERLKRVVAALEKITQNREHASMLINQRKSRGITWNELIQKLLSEP